jgi:hypothetical protein
MSNDNTHGIYAIAEIATGFKPILLYLIKMETRNLYKIMAKYGWTYIKYSNPFLPEDNPSQDQPNRWAIGLLSGPKNNIVCVRQASTDEEAMRYMAPSANSINEAITKSRILYEITDSVNPSERTSCRSKRHLYIGTYG